MNQMIELQTAVLHGPALNWAVAKAIGAGEIKVVEWGDGKTVSCIYQRPDGGCWANHYSPSTEWDQGGLLLDEHHVQTSYNGNGFSQSPTGEYWCAYVCEDNGREVRPSGGGPTALIAICRAVVASVFPNTVQVPAELVTP